MRRFPDLQRILILGLAGPLAALNIWLISQVFRYFEGLITLLVASAILAFLLNYPVQLFQRTHLSRSQAVTIVLFMTVTVLVVVGVTLLPVIVEQTTQLLNRIPDWLEASAKNLQALDLMAKERSLPLDLQGFSQRINDQIQSQLNPLAQQAVGLALGTLNWALNSTFVLVLAFYMLLDGNRLWRGAINRLPKQYGVAIGDSLQNNFHNFFISQILLAVFMMIALLPIFLALQVPFALLFVVLIGISEIIPLVGPALGIGLVLLLLLLQNPWLMVQVAIASTIQNTFANPVYCSMDALTRPQKEKTRAAWGIETLAHRYPEGIFVVGQSQTALTAIADLVETEDIRPALVIGTPAGFVGADVAKDRLADSLVPYITVAGRKGSAVVAAAIVNGLVDLAWQAYGQEQVGVS